MKIETKFKIEVTPFYNSDKRVTECAWKLRRDGRLLHEGTAPDEATARHRAKVAAKDSLRVHADCRNCGGASFSLNGGDCPACRGTGRAPVEDHP